MAPKQWTRTNVLGELRRIHRRERVAITRSSLEASGHGAVFSASVKLFGSFTTARRAAGIPKPRLPPRPFKYTRAHVLTEIAARVGTKRALNVTAVPQAMVHAARREFGGWPNAIEAAGLDYSAIRLTRANWTKPELVAMIRAGAKSGRIGVGPRGFISQKQATAAHRHFGSLRAAIAAAGLDADRLLRWKRRRVSELREKVEQLARARPTMTPTEFHYHPLARALRERFGSVRAALQLWNVRQWPVAVNPTVEPRAARGFWTANRVLEAIRERHRRGEPLSSKQAPERLTTAAKTYLGSWRAAIERAGLDYDEIRIGPAHGPTVIAKTGHGWKRTYVLQELRRLQREGRIRITSSSLNASGYTGLVTACLKHFGSFVRARRVARIPEPRKPSPPFKVARMDIILAITARVRDKLPVNAGAMPAVIVRAGQREFGRWDDALSAAGIDATIARRLGAKGR
ncbi:MAG TPA: hypothetical protein VH143_05850 [Kofleriaceae bacterium]|jgi:hypothetical protein|nr:hypothetical protein [Kofleriaceae bacterium]